LPRWVAVFRSVVGLFLRVRFRLLGFRRFCGRSRFAAGGVPVRVFRVARLGSLGARWFRCLGGWFSVVLLAFLSFLFSNTEAVFLVFFSLFQCKFFQKGCFIFVILS
jgi:hypothetical protein